MLMPVIVDSKSYNLNFSFKSYPSSSRRFDIIARTVLELVWLKESSIGDFLDNMVYIVFGEKMHYNVFKINIECVPKIYARNEYALLLHLIKHGGLIKASLDEVFQHIRNSTVIHLTENGMKINKATVFYEAFRRAIVFLGGHYDVPEDFLKRTSDLASNVLSVSIGSRSYLASHTIVFLTYFLYLRFRDLIIK